MDPATDGFPYMYPPFFNMLLCLFSVTNDPRESDPPTVPGCSRGLLTAAHALGVGSPSSNSGRYSRPVPRSNTTLREVGISTGLQLLVSRGLR